MQLHYSVHICRVYPGIVSRGCRLDIRVRIGPTFAQYLHIYHSIRCKGLVLLSGDILLSPALDEYFVGESQSHRKDISGRIDTLNLRK